MSLGFLTARLAKAIVRALVLVLHTSDERYYTKTFSIIELKYKTYEKAENNQYLLLKFIAFSHFS